jgi:hypothetical protein
MKGRKTSESGVKLPVLWVYCCQGSKANESLGGAKLVT